MRDLPILFSGAMVRAILEGRKTQTRRVMVPQPAGGVRISPFSRTGIEDGHGRELRCRHGRPGDRLWVRETWQVARHEPCLPHERDYQDLHSPVIRYMADGAVRRIQGNRSTGVGAYHGPVEKTRPSIFMPRWASRITLEVTDVRAERLQAISEEDAIAEGIERPSSGIAVCDARTWFHVLWDSINAQRGFGWDENPWVWAITFRRIEDQSDA